MKKVLLYTGYLLLVWGGFRYFFNLPEVIEELWFKPVIWLVPLFWWNIFLREKRVTLFGGNQLISLLVGLTVGCFYFFALRKVPEMSSSNWDLVGVALVTSVVEEIAFTGFVLGYLQKSVSEIWSIFFCSILVAIMRLPILLFDSKVGGTELTFVLIFVFAVAMINGVIRLKSGSVSGSILARFILNIALFV